MAREKGPFVARFVFSLGQQTTRSLNFPAKKQMEIMGRINRGREGANGNPRI